MCIKNNKEIKILSLFASGNVIVYIAVYLQAVLVNSTLEPTDLGKYSYYLSLLTVMISAISLTIYGAHLRFLGFVDTERLHKFIRKILISATLIYSTIVLVVWNEWYFIPLVALMWFNEEMYFFRSLTKIKLYTGMKFIQHIIIIIIFIGILVFLGGINYKAIILITGLSYVMTYLIFRPFRKKAKIVFVEEEEFSKREILKYSLPGAASAISLYLLAAADQIFINSYLTPLDLSNYAMALRTLAIIQLFTAVFMDYWPRFYFEKAKVKLYSEIKQMGFLFKISIILFSVLCIVLSTPIYFMMGAKNYVGQSTIIFSVLVFSEIFRVLGSINMTYRSFTKESIYNVTILGVLGLIKLLFNFLFIEAYGLNVLLVTTLGSYILYWIISIIISVWPEKLYMKTPSLAE